MSSRRQMTGYGSEKTIVIDAGIASEENIEIIKQKHLRYVAVSRRRTFPKDFWSDSTKKDLPLYDQKNKLQAKLAKKDGEAWLHCHSGIKEAKENTNQNTHDKKLKSVVRKN
ncbi:MAG: hypothetical protein ABIK15_06505 [Pseudomonadota bacterium]